MKRLHSILAVALIGASGVAWAEGGGTIISKGVKTTFVGAYAYARPDPFDASKQAIVVVLSSEAIDATAYDAVADREKAFSDFLFWNNERKPTSVRFTIGTDKESPIEQVGLAVLSGEGLHSSFSMGSAFYTLVLKENNGKRIEGSLRSTHESEKTSENGAYFDVHFALNVATGPAFGPGLPPDGGAPFDALNEYSRAVGHAAFSPSRDSLNAIADTVSDAQLKKFNQTLKSANGNEGKVKAILERMGEELPNSFRYVSGSIKGDYATIEIKGKVRDADGQEVGDSAPAIVTMKKESENWRFDGRNVPGGSKPAPGASKKGKSGK